MLYTTRDFKKIEKNDTLQSILFKNELNLILFEGQFCLGVTLANKQTLFLTCNSVEFDTDTLYLYDKQGDIKNSISLNI